MKSFLFTLVTRRPYCPGRPKELCFTTLSLAMQTMGMRLSVVKQSFFGLPGQYGRLVTRANFHQTWNPIVLLNSSHQHENVRWQQYESFEKPTLYQRTIMLKIHVANVKTYDGRGYSVQCAIRGQPYNSDRNKIFWKHKGKWGPGLARSKLDMACSDKFWGDAWIVSLC